MKRSWPSCRTNQLELLLQSSQSATTTVHETTTITTSNTNRTNHIQASAEAILEKHSLSAKGGRTLPDAIPNPDEPHRTPEGCSHSTTRNVMAPCALTAPVLVVNPQNDRLLPMSTTTTTANMDLGLEANQYHSISLSSNVAVTSTSASTLMRQYLELRTKCRTQKMHVRTLQRSLQHQQETLTQLGQERTALLLASSQGSVQVGMTSTALVVQLDNIQVGEQIVNGSWHSCNANCHNTNGRMITTVDS